MCDKNVSFSLFLTGSIRLLEIDVAQTARGKYIFCSNELLVLLNYLLNEYWKLKGFDFSTLLCVKMVFTNIANLILGGIWTRDIQVTRAFL